MSTYSLMDSQKTVLFGAVFAVAAGLFGFNTIVDGVVQENDSIGLQSQGSSITGHVTYTVYDKDGNIKAYQQTDNVVTVKGMNCAAEFLFDNSTVDTGDCSPTSGYTGFNYIAIGNQSSPTTPATDNTALQDDMTGDNSITRIQDTSVTHNAASGAGASTTVVVNTPSAFTFTNLPSGTTITESGLFDAPTGGNMFARQTFSTAVTSSDSLSVEWTITIS